jgi:hypothetical protein
MAESYKPQYVPDLFRDVSKYMKCVLEEHAIDYSRAEISLMRRTVVNMLEGVGITQETYDDYRHYSTMTCAVLIEICKIYHNDNPNGYAYIG